MILYWDIKSDKVCVGSQVRVRSLTVLHDEGTMDEHRAHSDKGHVEGRL